MRVSGFPALALTCALLAPAQSIEVKSHSLANGMKILIQEDHDIPDVAMYFFFRVGSRNERPGATGLSHFFEHMMFNGAARYGPKQFDIQMEKNGGRNNAYTTKDITVYTDWFPRAALPLMMDMEADRIRDLSFDPKMIASERGVVASERRLSVDNSNFGALDEQLNAAAFTAHPYHWPVIGWASDIEAWTLDDLRQHFRMGYAPNNCVMVVAGDVTEDEILALAKRYLEPIPRHDPPAPVRTIEPEQRGERRILLHKPAQLPVQLIAYHVPRSASPDHYAIEALVTVLAGGRSSRLYRRLVDRDQLAISVNAFHDDSLDPGLLVIAMQPRTGIDPARAERALFEELDRIGREGISADELQKARNQLSVDLYRELKTIAGKANLLGSYEVFYGDYRKLFTAPAELEKLTAAEVGAAARKYLNADNRTVATLVPEQSPEVSK
jgi:zinc protease